jgi:hypothetical protein
MGLKHSRNSLLRCRPAVGRRSCWFGLAPAHESLMAGLSARDADMPVAVNSLLKDDCVCRAFEIREPVVPSYGPLEGDCGSIKSA